MTTKEIRISGQGFTAAFTPWAGEFVDDYNWPGIRDEYNVRLQELAPDGVVWGWGESGPCCRARRGVYGGVVLARWHEIQDEELIDFETIARHHETLS